MPSRTGYRSGTPSGPAASLINSSCSWRNRDPVTGHRRMFNKSFCRRDIGLLNAALSLPHNSLLRAAAMKHIGRVEQHRDGTGFRRVEPNCTRVERCRRGKARGGKRRFMALVRPGSIPENPQMAPPSRWGIAFHALGGWFQRHPAGPLQRGPGSLGIRISGIRRLPDSICQGQQIIGIRWRRHIRHGQSQNFPAPRHSQSVGMLGTQIVTVRLGIGGQRTQHRSGIGIHVRQSGDCRLLAAGP